MPARLRPTAPIAADAVLVGDPGRALMLAQELLEAPKMSNHARGLWGYFGQTSDGRELTVQATGMGGPSAAVVLADLAGLGLRRAIRVGTCAGLTPELKAGELLVIGEAHSWGGPGEGTGQAVSPDAQLTKRLEEALSGARRGTVASLDKLHSGGAEAPVIGADTADMQTAALLDQGRALGVAVAAVLVVAETASGELLDDAAGEAVAKRAGVAASTALST